MTSNIGSDIILQAKEINNTVKNEIQKRLLAHFRPEFLNRIDDIVFFNMLTKNLMFDIARAHIKSFEQRMEQKGIHITISDKAIHFIAEQGFEQEFGARPLKRAIQQYLIVPASQHLLRNPETKSMTIDYTDTITIQ